MKLEIANELGMKSNNLEDKGNLTSRSNGNYGGNLGGTMTRRLIEMAEQELINKNK
ncbi:small, acid-soluble spore protein, alpha/beta type [Wukongibacter baidiensis]